jgi:hypothetical protein
MVCLFCCVATATQLAWVCAFQADPGAWQLSLRAGRSSDIYEIVSHENTDSEKDSKDITVLVNRYLTEPMG